MRPDCGTFYDHIPIVFVSSMVSSEGVLCSGFSAEGVKQLKEAHPVFGCTGVVAWWTTLGAV